MGSHQEHHSNEKKPVAFTVPLIFGSVVIFTILLFVSLGDPKPGCHGNEAHCEKTEKGCCAKDGKEAHGAETDAHAEPAAHSEEHH